MAVLLVALMAGGCGGGEDAKTGAANRAHAQSDDQRPVGTDKEGEGGAGELLKTAAGRKHAKQQIRNVVHHFFVASSRGDYRAVCSLFSPKGLVRTGGATACRNFFKQALSNQTKSTLTDLTISSITFVEHGEAAQVMFRGFGKLFELEPTHGQWVIARAPGV